MYSLVVKEGAKLMVDDAYTWYKEQSAGLGEKFLQNCKFILIGS